MGNLLLDALPRELYRSLQADFERLPLKRGQVLHEPGRTRGRLRIVDRVRLAAGGCDCYRVVRRPTAM